MVLDQRALVCSSACPPRQRASTIPWLREALRAAGAAVGVFLLVNVIGEVVRPPFDTTADWLSLPGPPWLRRASCATAGAVLVAGASWGTRPPWLRRLGAALSAVVVGLAMLDTLDFYRALLRGLIHTPAVVPASLLVAGLFAALLVDFTQPAPSMARGRLRAVVRGGAATLVLLALPLIRMVTFGPTRYERSAACAVVFGARVWSDGRPSEALADRVDEAVRLYQRGRVSKLLMSGGIDPKNGISEPEVMRARAEDAGVRPGDILLDPQGVDTASTARNVAGMLGREGLGSALVVTHYYHEPRAKMLFDRAGVRAWTVPATMRRRLMKEPYFIAREIAAYYHSLLVE